jgi:peptidylprolyl isomerase
MLSTVGAVMLACALVLVGAYGARWLDGRSHDFESTSLSAAQGSTTSESAASPEITPKLIEELLSVIDPRKRAEILGTAENFSAFVEQEEANQSVIAAAYANGANQNEAIKTLMERAGQRVLAEVYLNQVVRSNLDPDFPSEEQVREAYEKNPDAFVVPQRLHIWQIFLPLSEEADEAERQVAWETADRLALQIRSGKADFGAMAQQYSRHEASRLNDGYMGLLKVSELLPPIAEAVEKLTENETSTPIATATGVHIIKRGATVEGGKVEFDRVQAKIRERLLREAAVKVRRAAVEKISETYPVAPIEGDLESLRATLETGTALP